MISTRTGAPTASTVTTSVAATGSVSCSITPNTSAGTVAAGSRDRADLAQADDLAAHGADVLDAGVAAAVPVDDLDRRTVGCGPLVAPLPQGAQHRPQRAALVGEDVLVAERPLLVGAALDNAVGHEVVEPLGEHVAGDAQAALDVVETVHPEEQVAHDEEGPPLTHHLEGLGDRATHVVEALPSHADQRS